MPLPESTSAEYKTLTSEVSLVKDERARLQARLELFEQAIGASALGIAICDTELRYVVFNRALQGITNRSAAEALGRRVDDLFPFLERAGVMDDCRRALAGTPCVSGDHVLDDPKNPRRGWTLSTHSPIRDAGGRVVGVLSTIEDVTPRKKLELALEEANRLNCELLDNLCALVLRLDPSGRVTYASQHALEVLGYTAEALLGRSVRETLLPENAKASDGSDPFTTLLATPLDHDLALSGHRTSSGRCIWVSWSHRVQRNADGRVREFLSVGIEVTERELARMAAEQQERRFQSLYQHMTEGVALHSVVRAPDGTPIDYRIEDVNPRFAEILGIERKDAVGKLATEVYGTSPAPYLDQYASVASTGQARRIEGYVAAAQKWMEISVAPLGPDGFAAIFTDVSERKRQEEELRRRTEELDRFFSLSLDLHCISSADGQLLRANSAWTSTLGYPMAELLGRNFIDLVHPDDRQATLDMADGFAAGHVVVDFVNRFRHRDGSWHWLEWRAAAEPGGVLYGVARDITQQREDEERQRQNAAELKRSQVVARLGSYRFDLVKGTWTCSDVLSEILGLEPGREHANAVWMSILPPEDREALTAYVRQDVLTDRKPFEREHRIVRHADGATRWARTLGELDVSADGTPVALFGTLQDVTTRKEAEAEHAALAAKIQHSQKLESLGVLAGGIAHDFNNLLTSVLGNADLALDVLPRASPARANLEDIETAARNAAELCRQMLAYSGKGRFQSQVLDLRSVVEEMGHLLSASVSKRAELRYTFPDELLCIQGDPAQVRQVIMNLITNASEAIGENSGVIHVRAGAMTCDEADLRGIWSGGELSPGRFVWLEVSDTGVGMDEATIKRLFDPFFTTKFTGRGLGLAAVQGIMRGHHGAIEVRSQPGKGATFKLLFPATDRHPSTIPPSVGARGWRGEGTVLLVDDEEIVRRIGRAILERAGLTVITANDGEQALEAFRQARDIVCIVLDLTMPRMDGETCFRELQRLSPGVKVLLSSGYTETEVVSRFGGKGLAGFVQKPYRAADLLATVRSVVECPTSVSLAPPSSDSSPKGV